jgi:polyhydroxybutyrate depolymerase
MRGAVCSCFAGLLAVAALGCSSGNASSSGGGDATTSSSSGGTGGGGGGPVIGGDRPVDVHVPANLAPGTKAPLVLMLHGYGVDGDVEEIYLQLQPFADSRTFFYAHPNGKVDKSGSYYWNATDACCDYDHSHVDDSKYLASVITEIEAAYPVDPRRVYVVGHSNGAFMAYRLACDHADLIAGVGSLAGAMWEDTSRCQPSQVVSILEIHGTADTEVIYDGSTKENYPSAPTTVSDWATFDGCAPDPTTQMHAKNLDQGRGMETNVTRYASCKKGRDVELWTIVGGSHLPNLTSSFRPDLIDWLFAQTLP